MVMTRSTTESRQIADDQPARSRGPLRLAVLGTIVAALMLAVAPVSASAATSVSGTVTDAGGHAITTQDICVVPYNHLPHQPPGVFAPAGTHTVAGSDGSWSFTTLAPDTYKFRAQDCEDSPRNDLPTFYDPEGTGWGEEVALADGSAVTGLDIALAAATSVSGRLFGGPGTAAPLADMCVTAFDDMGFAQAGARTDAVGFYFLRHLDPTRTYTISFGPCNIGPFVTEYAFWTESYGGGSPTVLSPTLAQPLTGIDGHLTPILSIGGGPAHGSVTTATSAAFQFAAAIWPGATFMCSLDGAPLSACGATYSVTGLTAGAHILQVQAWIGNLHTPVSTVNWTVGPTAPQSMGSLSTPEAPNVAAPAGKVASRTATKTASPLKVRLPSRLRRATLLRSGLPLAVSSGPCSRSCRVSIDVYMSVSVAGKQKLAKQHVRIGAVSGWLTSRPEKLVVRLSTKARSALARFDRPLRLTLVITTTGSSSRPRVTTRSLRITP